MAKPWGLSAFRHLATTSERWSARARTLTRSADVLGAQVAAASETFWADDVGPDERADALEDTDHSDAFLLLALRLR